MKYSIDYIKYIRKLVGKKLVILNFAVAIVIKSNKILLHQRTDSKKWGLPGGAVNLNESLEDAAVRETREETGIIVKVKHQFSTYSSPRHTVTYSNGDNARCIVTAFLCKEIGNSNNFDQNETMAIKYFDFDEIPMIHNQQHLEIINEVKKQIKNIGEIL